MADIAKDVFKDADEVFGHYRIESFIGKAGERRYHFECCEERVRCFGDSPTEVVAKAIELLAEKPQRGD